MQVFDPYIADSLEIEGLFAESMLAAATRADALLLLVHHREFLQMDVSAIAKVVKQHVILDTRNVLSRPEWEAAGFEVLALGDGKPTQI